MLRTIEGVLGCALSVHDAGVPPMTQPSTPRKRLTYSRFHPATYWHDASILNKYVQNRSHTASTHDAAWWEAQTKGWTSPGGPNPNGEIQPDPVEGHDGRQAVSGVEAWPDATREKEAGRTGRSRSGSRESASRCSPTSVTADFFLNSCYF